MCVCVYVCACACVCVCVCVFVHAHVFTCVCVFMHVCVLVYARVCRHEYSRVLTLTFRNSERQVVVLVLLFLVLFVLFNFLPRALVSLWRLACYVKQIAGTQREDNTHTRAKARTQTSDRYVK